MRDVEGRVAFITGGGSGVGLGMAKAFVGAGMRVAIADIAGRPPRRRRRPSSGVTSIAIRLDVTDRRGVRARRRRDRARARKRARPLQQRGHQPLQRHRRGDVPGLGLGARRQPRRRRQRRRHVRARGSRRTARAGTSSTRRRWPRSSPARAPGSTRRRSSRCTGCPTRCAGACCRTGSASRWSAPASSGARSTRAT